MGEGGREEDKRGLFTVGETESSSVSLLGSGEGGESVTHEAGSEDNVSPTRVDELRQRRLQRFHSMPASPVTDLAAQLRDDKTASAAEHVDKQSDKEQ